jgi:hypothetical protein
MAVLLVGLAAGAGAQGPGGVEATRVAPVAGAESRLSGTLAASTRVTTTTAEGAVLTWTTWDRIDEDVIFGGPGDQWVWGVVAGGPGLVAVGSDGGGGDVDAAVWTSVDGLTWTRVPHDGAVLGGPGDQSMWGIVAGGPGLVAVGSDGGGGDVDAAVWTSVDGLTWTRVPHDEAVLGGPGDQSMVGVATSGPGLVAYGSDDVSAVVWTSADGLTWNRVQGVFGGGIMEVAAGGPGLVAVGAAGGAAVWISPDGLTWTRVERVETVFDDPPSELMAGVLAGGPGLVAVGYDGVGGDVDAAVWTSVDGLTWTRVPHNEAVFGNGTMYGVVAGGPGLVAFGSVGSDGGGGDVDAAVWTSVDGLTWTRVPDDEGAFGGQDAQRIEGVVAGDPGLIAVGFDFSGGDPDAAVWVWRVSRPTPQAAEGFRAADTLAPELTTRIPTPLDVSMDPAVVGTNLLLAAVAMLLFVMAEELLRRTLAAEEGRLQRLVAPARWLARGQQRLNGLLQARLGRGAADALRLGAIVLLYGLIFSFLEPGWNPITVTGLFLLMSMTLAFGLVGLSSDVVRWWTARRWGLPARLTVRPANVLLAVASTAFSRLITLVPGIMIGTPEAFEIDEAAADDRQRHRLLRVGALALLGVGVTAWLFTLLTDLAQRADLARGLALAVGGLEALLLVVFAVAVQKTFVEMLGMEGSFGWALSRRSRPLWFASLVSVAFIFWHTLINPRGDLATALGETSVRAVLITIAAFSLFSVAVWATDRLLQRGHRATQRG